MKQLLSPRVLRMGGERERGAGLAEQRLAAKKRSSSESPIRDAPMPLSPKLDFSASHTIAVSEPSLIDTVPALSRAAMASASVGSPSTAADRPKLPLLASATASSGVSKTVTGMSGEPLYGFTPDAGVTLDYQQRRAA